MATNARRDPPFTRIAYQNMGNDKIIVNRLQREMETWMRSKKSVNDLIGRVQKVTGMSYDQARRVAQTERTRVQGEARYDALKGENKQRRANKQHAARKEWVARGDGKTRDTHAALSGTVEYVDRYFVSPSGARLLYPGDPSAPAAEIINCRCYMRRVEVKR